MNGAHFHLVVNHLPIIFPLVGILLIVIGLITKSNPVIRSAYFILILAAIASAVAMSSGEGAEEVVENMNGVNENFIEQHEESAELFAVLSYALGGVSLLGLWTNWKQKKMSKIISIGVLIFGLVVMVFAKIVGTTGGEIRHTEIRTSKGVTPSSDNGGLMENDED